jgi:hypothetical protein
VVAAFRVGPGWGLAVLLLGWTLVALILFAVRHWSEARRPLLIWSLGFVLSAAAWAVAVAGLGAAVLSSAQAGDEPLDATGKVNDAPPGVLPPPRPTALPTPPSWEAIVHELSSEEGEPSPNAGPRVEQAPERREEVAPASATIPWQELPRYAGRKLDLALHNGSEVTVQLLEVEPERIRVRQVMGGGAAAYWVERDQVLSIRPAG